MEQIKRDVIVIVGVCSVILTMLLGVVSDARPEIIIIRAFLSLSASLIIGFILVSAIEKIFHTHQELQQKQGKRESEKFNDDSKIK